MCETMCGNKVHTFQLYVITDLESLYSEFNKGHGMLWKIYVSVWKGWNEVRKDNNCAWDTEV